MELQSISAKLSVDVEQIIRPLVRTGCVNAFSHSRIFSDGSRAELWSDPAALEHTYLKTNYTVRTHAPTLYEKENVFFLFDKMQEFESKTRERYEKHIAEMKELFNHDNTLIVRGNDDICEEFFCFYGEKIR